MEMTIEECANMLTAKEKCMKRETSGTDTDCNNHNCDECSLCYEQGNMGNQKEALRLAASTMLKYQKIVDIVSVSDEEFKQCGLKELKEILEVITEREGQDEDFTL